MEFAHLTVLAIFSLALMRADASQSAKDYWQSIWPNTSMPKSLSDLLQSYGKTNLPIKAEEGKQYWTVFLEHDLYPGKTMNLGFDKHSGNQPFGARVWKQGQTSQPFGARVWKQGKTNQPFGARVWKQGETSQPFGARIWPPGKTSQPQGKTSQPFRENTFEIERQNHNEFCGNPAAIGEDKYCATSLESMMDFAISKLGKNIKVISSSFAQNQDQYVVEEVNKIGKKAVMCHRLNFQNVVFYCHQVNATIAYMVPLVASDGTKAKALTICHHDTRGMNPDMLYTLLNVKPGTVPVCHFVGNKAIAWVPNLFTSESCVV